MTTLLLVGLAAAPPELLTSYTADVVNTGFIKWSGTKRSDFAVKKLRWDVNITSPIAQAGVTYFYFFRARSSRTTLRTA